MSFRASFLPLACFLLLAACDPGPTDPDGGLPLDADVDPALELGTGEGLFSSFEDGETLDLVSGCQGSQHVWVALRAWGIEPRGPIIQLSLVRDSDGAVVSQAFQVRVSLDPVPGTTYAEVYGLTLVVPEPDGALDEDLTLRATVTDMNEVTVMDERPVRIAWGEGGCRGGGLIPPEG
jgi:hypothetical protein